ncbi:MAG: CDP-alcohol phosphatidyltransferase family protein [Candidatus Hydrogenedentes bacterium]|nr:CDP-alcohol phosphatidyltransferase family protein [Candidatus Hydrogenedentota bacterium]
MTLANRITIFRLSLIPVLCVCIFFYSREREWLRWAALGVYVFVAVSDFADGFIARRYQQRSRLGARLDPLADKLVVNLGLVFLAANWEFGPRLPMWFPVFILGRDIFIVMGAYTIKVYAGKLRVEPRFSGKLSTAFQIATIIGMLLGVSFLPFLYYSTVAVSLYAVLGYVAMGYRQITQRSATG